MSAWQTYIYTLVELANERVADIYIRWSHWLMSAWQTYIYMLVALANERVTDIYIYTSAACNELVKHRHALLMTANKPETELPFFLSL